MSEEEIGGWKVAVGMVVIAFLVSAVVVVIPWKFSECPPASYRLDVVVSEEVAPYIKVNGQQTVPGPNFAEINQMGCPEQFTIENTQEVGTLPVTFQFSRKGMWDLKVGAQGGTFVGESTKMLILPGRHEVSVKPVNQEIAYWLRRVGQP